MAARLFGTDGVRGVANADLSPELAFRLGQAAALFLGHQVVIGKDTRKSGDMLESAVIAGATSCGADVYMAGVIPTPAVALLVRELDVDGGIVISASHNPPEYNGIKFFDKGGYKLPIAREDQIEAFLHDGSQPVRGTGTEVGSIFGVDDAVECYVDHAIATTDEDLDFSGMKVAIDCAHGASYVTTPEAFALLGMQVVPINTDWNGMDINVGCGSTHLEQLSACVLENGCNLGIAHDGDADRMLAVDEKGHEIDGDVVETICALDLKARGKLAKDTVVSTVMSNMGLAKALEPFGIKVVSTQVGDRHVLECMRENGYVLGGEQSGHTIFLDHNSTGDGLITAVQLVSAMVRSGKPLSELSELMKHYPQSLINVEVADKGALEGNEAIASTIAEAETHLAGEGRVLVRASGTEPLVRVMVEASDEQTATTVAESIASVVESQLR